MRSAICSAVLVIVGLVFPAASRAAVTLESAVTRVSVTQGNHWTGAVSLVNDGDSPATLSLSTVNLERGPDGAPAPVLDLDPAVIPYTLAGWMSSAVRTVRISPHSRVSVPITVEIPEYAAPGAHLAAVLLRTVPEESGTLRVSTAIAAAFEVTVNGPSRHEVSLLKFGPLRVFMARGPVQVRALLANLGTTVAPLRGYLGVDTLFGRAANRLAIAPGNGGPQLYPGSTKEFILDAALGPGIWRARLDVSDGSQKIADSAWFFIIPWPLGIAVLAGLFVAFWGSRTAVRRLLRVRR